MIIYFPLIFSILTNFSELEVKELVFRQQKQLVKLEFLEKKLDEQLNILDSALFRQVHNDTTIYILSYEKNTPN